MSVRIGSSLSESPRLLWLVPAAFAVAACARDANLTGSGPEVAYQPFEPEQIAEAPATWPQLHGVASDRRSPERLDEARLGAEEGGLLWRVPTERGFSSFVTEGERVYTLVLREVDGATREVCVALDARDGSEVWAAACSRPDYDGGGDAGAGDNKGGDGPRSTPSVADGRVFVLDASLVLSAFDAAGGAPLWKHDVVAEYGGRTIRWQNAASPLVEGGRVLLAGGGEGRAFLAFDAGTGELAWASGDERMTHATPVAATLHGERHAIFMVQSGLVALDPATGAERWRAEYPYRTSTAASPVVSGDHVYVSAGYGVGAGVFRVDRAEDGAYAAELLWQQRNKLMNHWSTPVCLDGYLYGMFSFKKYGDGPLACVELATGDTKWAEDGFGPGNVIAVGDRLVALSDAGEVVIVEPSPDRYRERARADVLEGKCWSSPAFHGGTLFVRSTLEGVALDLSAAPADPAR